LIFILYMYNLCISSFSAQRDGSMKQDTNPAYTCTSIQEMLSLFLSCCSYATASHVTSAYSPCNVTSPFPQIFSEFVGLDGTVSTEKRQTQTGKSANEDGILQRFQKLYYNGATERTTIDCHSLNVPQALFCILQCSSCFV